MTQLDSGLSILVAAQKPNANLNSFFRAVNAATDLSSCLDLCCDFLSRSIPSDRVELVLADTGSSELTLERASGQEIPSRNQGSTWQAIDADRAMLSSTQRHGRQSIETLAREHSIELPFVAALSTPMKMTGLDVGFIVLYSSDTEAFTDGHVAVVEEIAASIGPVLELRRTVEWSIRFGERNRAFSQIGRALTESTDFSVQANEISPILQTLVPHDGWMVRLTNEDHSAARTIVQQGSEPTQYSEEMVGAWELLTDADLTRHVARSGEAI